MRAPSKNPLSVLVAVCIAVVILLASGPASAAGKVLFDRPGPVVLAPAQGGMSGEFAIRNAGSEPLVVSRVALRGDDDDVRLPPRVSARFADGKATATIEPGESKAVTIAWMPERDPRMKQVWGHVVVTSNDEDAGEVAMGFTATLAQPMSFVTGHLLTWLFVLPLFGALAIVLLGAARKDSRGARWIPVVVGVLQCALAAVVYARFSPEVTRVDGNDGLQLVERVVWVRAVGIEYFVGVDGANVAILCLTAIVSLVGAACGLGAARRTNAYHATYLMLVCGIVGVTIALDLVVFFVAWEVVLVALYFLIAAWGGPKKEYAAMKLFLFASLGSAAILAAFLLLHVHSDRTFLVDGTAVRHSFAIPDLWRVAYAKKDVLVLGAPLVKVAWVLLFAGFAIAVPMFPLHTWHADAHAEAPHAANVVLAGAVVRLAPYALLRVNVGILPEATRWAAGAVVAFGVVNVVYGALVAMAQTDLKRVVAFLSMSQAGFCLLGLGALTPQGLAGGVVTAFAQGISVPLLFVVVSAIETRAGTREIGRLGGLAKEMPVAAAVFGLGALASVGVPGLVGFWGELLALTGAFPLHRALALVAAIGALLGAATAVWTLQRVFLGKLKESWATSGELAPWGGKFPDLGVREVLVAAPLAALVIVLGVWPVPLMSVVSGGVRDLGGLVNPPGPDQIAWSGEPQRYSFSASAPPMISISSFVIAAWRARL